MLIDSPWLVLDISPACLAVLVAGAVAVAALRCISRERDRRAQRERARLERDRAALQRREPGGERDRWLQRNGWTRSREPGA